VCFTIFCILPGSAPPSLPPTPSVTQSLQSPFHKGTNTPVPSPSPVPRLLCLYDTVLNRKLLTIYCLIPHKVLDTVSLMIYRKVMRVIPLTSVDSKVWGLQFIYSIKDILYIFHNITFKNGSKTK